MNDYILNTEIQEFINSNLNSDIISLLLKGTSFESIETLDIIEQIEAKKKCKLKLPSWFHTGNIYYPNKLNIEQSSSEITAKYKANLISGNSLIDLTGGFGVDCFFFSKQFKSVTHCEINKKLSELVNHNFIQLKIENIVTKNEDGIEYLENIKQKFNWIYVDPSRRHDSKGKVFFLNDCLPNIPIHLKAVLGYTNNIMIKTSPLLDISSGIKELMNVKTIHVVAINNEVKELLWIIEKNYNDYISIQTVNIQQKEQQVFNYIIDEESHVETKYSEPLIYLYEPNSAILKAGAFNTIAKHFDLKKLHKHSHLYTSNKLIDFPGRVFKIINLIPYNKRNKLQIKNANIATRNFPQTVNQIRKKLKINDGGDTYIFATTNRMDQKIFLICSKII